MGGARGARGARGEVEGGASSGLAGPAATLDLVRLPVLVWRTIVITPLARSLHTRAADNGSLVNGSSLILPPNRERKYHRSKRSYLRRSSAVVAWSTLAVLAAVGCYAASTARGPGLGRALNKPLRRFHNH